MSPNYTCLLLNDSHLFAQQLPCLPQDEITMPSTSLSSSCQENTLQMVNYANDYDIILRSSPPENDHKHSHIKYQCRAVPTLLPALSVHRLRTCFAFQLTLHPSLLLLLGRDSKDNDPSTTTTRPRPALRMPFGLSSGTKKYQCEGFF